MNTLGITIEFARTPRGRRAAAACGARWTGGTETIIALTGNTSRLWNQGEL